MTLKYAEGTVLVNKAIEAMRGFVDHEKAVLLAELVVKAIEDDVEFISNVEIVNGDDTKDEDWEESASNNWESSEWQSSDDCQD